MASARYTLNIDPEDLKPDEPIEYTKKQKMANWWHYNWKIVAVIVVLVAIAGHYISRSRCPLSCRRRWSRRWAA